MKFDYIPGASPARPQRRRLGLVAVLGLSVTAGLIQLGVREGSAVAGNSQPDSSGLHQNLAASALETNSAAGGQGGADFDGIIQTAVKDALTVPEASQWTTVSVKSGQSLSVIFDALGLAHDEVFSLLSLGGEVQRLKKLNAGDELHIRVADDRLEGLTYALDERRTLEVRRGDHGLEAVTLTAEIERHSTEVAGEIRDSLFLDGRRAKLSDRLIMELADIFGYDIDFAQDLHPGDRFAVVYDQLYKGNKKLRDGDILAAEFTNQGRKLRAVRFTTPDGNTAYYTPQGQSLRKAFIRTPVDFARISSPFNLRRLHPILHTIRAHKGTDYAAGTGTPIKATGDGKISFQGKKSGYGNVVMIKHGSGVETLYAHMSRFRSGLSVGSRVRQGQVIGYVGNSGLATAPHLHYEFRIDGIHKNPMTVPLPRANPVDPRYMARFRTDSATMVAALERADTRLASASPANKK
ncbi:peptidase M23 [Stagnimonas aquatica]|uniref:Peptidase M23 n=1 Tax=Stagnimonas aquatica TaxID=2689987 RepID=A0A3N0VKS2_9GAMM|nr:M23 family metallopeptidase [Stagnimonas aquatica]ROH93366.1 peptidase M23 [Stagnimonas aquatica]